VASGSVQPGDPRGHAGAGGVCHIRGVAVALGPNRRRLVIQTSVGLACVAVVVVGLWLAAGYAGMSTSPTSGDTLVQATVTAGASCQGTDTEDSLSVAVAGHAHQAKLDGCGHQRGEHVGVLLPTGFTDGALLEPAAAAPGDSSGLSHRVAFLLLIVATVVGGAFARRFARTRDTARRPAPAREDGLPPDFDDSDYHSDIRPVARDHDPEATGVDWFEDSSAHLPPVPPPADVSQRADRS
jgi:hypothetical protein